MKPLGSKMMDFSGIRALQNEAEYEAALAAIRPYFENEPNAGTPEAENFDALFLLIEAYEHKFHCFWRASTAAPTK